MKNKIPDFLKDKLEKKYALTKNFPKEIQEFLLNYSQTKRTDFSSYLDESVLFLLGEFMINA